MIRKNMRLLFIVACFCFVVTGCISNDKEKSIKPEFDNTKNDESAEGEDIRPLGNVVIKDEDGNILITVDDILMAETTTNEMNDTVDYCVSLKFTKEGTKKFADVTEKNIGKILSVYVDDEVVSAPRVMAKIPDGVAVISGMMSYDEANELVEKIYAKSENANDRELAEIPKLKITENDGTILVTEKDIDTFYVQSMEIGKGGSAMDVIIIVFSDEGSKVLSEKTSKLVGQEINLVVNGNLVFDKKLNESIDDGELLITANELKYEIKEVTSQLSDIIQ